MTQYPLPSKIFNHDLKIILVIMTQFPLLSFSFRGIYIFVKIIIKKVIDVVVSPTLSDACDTGGHSCAFIASIDLSKPSLSL